MKKHGVPVSERRDFLQLVVLQFVVCLLQEPLLIDQDPLVKPAKLIKRSGGIDIIARPLYNGDTAICFFNTSGKKKPVEFEIDNLKNDEYLEFRPSPRDYEIHDLWSDNREQGIKIACSVPAHGVKVFRISR